MTKEELDAILNKMLREITIINTNWVMWNGLRDALQEGSEYNKLLEYSPCFWTITLNNLLSKALLGTAKLYDENKKCMGLQKIINICEQNQKLFSKNRTTTYTDGYTGEKNSFTVSKDISESIRISKQKYQDIHNFRTQLITLRDKYLAHADKDIFLDIEAFYNEVALKKDALEKLIETAENILNSFLADLSDTRVYTEFENSDDYKNLLRYAKEGKEAVLQRIRSKTNNNADFFRILGQQ